MTVFIGNAACALLEFFAVFGCPPIAEIAFGIKLATLIVKAVCEFVADHQADAAHVDGVVERAIEKRRPKNSGREADLIVTRQSLARRDAANPSTKVRATKIPVLVAVLWIHASHELKAKKFTGEERRVFLCTTT
ncbi:MAG: hypothetical protein JWM83_2777 [Candidatus Angelobacter sp.]|nr:hypothetical protein [Candidatus Angelobacter sp.]